jgi:outer membrane protein assembly factor BamB
MVYVAADHSKLYAITSSGGLAWTYTSGVALNGSPAVADGIVYVAATDHKLYAINATDGSLVWSALTGDAAGRSAPPASLNAPSEKTLVSVPSDR